MSQQVNRAGRTDRVKVRRHWTLNENSYLDGHLGHVVRHLDLWGCARVEVRDQGYDGNLVALLVRMKAQSHHPRAQALELGPRQRLCALNREPEDYCRLRLVPQFIAFSCGQIVKSCTAKDMP